MISKIKIKISLMSALIFAPLITLAQLTSGNTGELGRFGVKILNFIQGTLVPFVFAVALLAFIYGMYLFFIQGGGEEDSRKEGKKYLLWSIVALVMMVSIWGIVSMIAGGLGFDNTETITDLIPNAIQ